MEGNAVFSARAGSVHIAVTGGTYRDLYSSSKTFCFNSYLLNRTNFGKGAWPYGEGESCKNCQKSRKN